MKMCLGSILSLLFSSVVIAFPQCPQGHCAKVSEVMNQFCISNGMSGKPFLVIKDGSYCTCPCSCVSENTHIDAASEEIPIGKLMIDNALDTPMALEMSGNVDRLFSSSVKKGKVYQILFSNGSELISSENHTFITKDQRTITAEELTVGGSVLDKNKNEVFVFSVSQREYTGNLMNVITNEKKIDAYDHVISTNGILSGDYLLQIQNDTIKEGVDIRTGKVALYFAEKDSK